MVTTCLFGLCVDLGQDWSELSAWRTPVSREVEGDDWLVLEDLGSLHQCPVFVDQLGWQTARQTCHCLSEMNSSYFLCMAQCCGINNCKLMFNN